MTRVSNGNGTGITRQDLKNRWETKDTPHTEAEGRGKERREGKEEEKEEDPSRTELGRI